MESLVEDVNALVAPDLSTDGSDWCDNCQALRKEIRKLQEVQGQNFAKLKQKIISTDMLIKKYKAKCDDYDILGKKLEEANKKADKHMRQNSILETQLKAALLDVDPLRKNKLALEHEVQEQKVKIQELTDKVVAFEGTQRQYEYLTKTTSADMDKLDSEKKELMQKLKAMETGKVTKEAAKEYKYEISNLKKENQKLSKNEKRLDTKLKSALMKIENLSQALKDAKCSPIRRKRTSSNHLLLSPTKSPIKRSPRGRGMSPVKQSPSRSPRTRTLSGREIKFIPKVDEPDLIDDSDGSSDDQGSVYSMSLMFSPLVKCLSPLPPSPVCYGNNIESGDDSSLSDIADELEQQLTETFADDQEPTESVNEIPDDSKNEDENETLEPVANTDKVEPENDTNNAQLFDLDDYEEQDEDIEQNNRNFEEVNVDNLKDNVTDSVDKHSDDKTKDSSKVGVEKMCNAHSSPPTSSKDDSEHQCNTLENKMTGDIISVSRTSVLAKESQPIVTQNKINTQIPECQNTEVKLDTHDIKSTDNALKLENEIDKDTNDEKVILKDNEENIKADVGDNTEGWKNKDLPRGDTSEFIPVMGESTERLSDSETDTFTTDMKCSTDKPLPTCKGDASSVIVEKTVETKAEDYDLENNEVEFEIEEQTEQVEMQYPPTRGMLKRQRNISSESSQIKGDKFGLHEQKSDKMLDKDLDNVFTTGRKKKKGKNNKSKPKFDKNSFIAFQKSSSGTLADEIEHMENDVEYECNDRKEIPAHKDVMHAVTNKEYLKIKDKKLIHKRKYKDLDNFKDENMESIFQNPGDSKNKNKIVEAKAKDKTEGPKVSKSLSDEEILSAGKEDQVKGLNDDNTEKQNLEKESERDKDNMKEEVTDNSHKSKEKQETITSADNSELRSQNKTDSEKINTQDQVLNSHTKDSESSELKLFEQLDSLVPKLSNCSNDLCDAEIQNTLGALKGDIHVLNSNEDSIDTNKSHPSRQLSTGFVVGSPYTDNSSHRKTPLDKDKHFHAKVKSKDIDSADHGHVSDHALEQIEEECDSEILNDEESVSNSDKVTADNSNSVVDQPGCSYHYKESSEDLDNLNSSISLSQEIERILDKKPGKSVSRIISCTPDMLDSGSADFLIDNNSRGITPSEESVSRPPLSPLPISPFDFVCPISPLPPSPLREIERVSPLSTDELDDVDEQLEDQSETQEDEVHEFENEVSTCDIESIGLKHIRSKVLSVEAMSLPIPDALSPIKSPNQKLCNKKIKKGKTSAFQPIGKDTGTSLTMMKNEKNLVQHLDEQIVNDDHLKENMHDHINKSQTFNETKVKKKVNRRKSKDSSSKMLSKPNVIDTHTEISTQSKTNTESDQGNVRLKTQTKTILPGTVNKVKMVTEEKEQVLKEEVDGVKEEEVMAEIPDASSGQDNLAFKKKTRLAHRPNIQALRPSKVQVIDIQALPTQINRKRRSLDAADTDGKKQCKGTTFHKDKSSAASKEESKRMQTFLKSYEAPDSFVTRVLETDKGESIVEKIFDLCIECLGRVRTDTVDIVYSHCENEAYKTLDLHWPFLSDVEKQATKLLHYLYSLDNLNVSYQTVMTRLWDCIFGRNLAINVIGQMCFCRVFTALSCLKGDVEQVRVLFCNIVSCGHLNVRQFVVPVVSVWPEVLMKGETDHSMLNVLEEVVTKALLDQGLDVNKKILVILQKLCGWSGCCGRAESMLYSLLSKLEDKCKHQPETQVCHYEMTKAIHLLSVCGGWAWFKEFFIMRHGLQSAVNKYRAKNTTKVIPPTYVCAILRISGSVISTLSETVPVKDIEQCTKNWMLPLLKDSAVDEAIVECCVEVLLELSPFLPSLLKGLHSWFVSQPHNVKRVHGEKLESIRKLYKHRLNFSCKQFV